jgi:signal transduction histidine kinase
MKKLRMNHILHTLEVIFYAFFAVAFIGLLFFFLGVQPLRNETNQMNVWICICLVCGAMLTMAIYNLSLRFFIRREKAALYFAVFCVAQTFRFLFMPDSIGWQLFPGLPEQITILILRQVPYSISLAGLILFIYEIFGEGRLTKIKHTLIVVTVFVSFSITALGFDHTVWRAVLGLPVVVMYAAACIAVIVKSSVFRKNRLSVLYLCGFILFAISGFFASTAINGAPYIVVAFNFVFAVIHSILLSDRFAKTKAALDESRQKAEMLAAKTDFYHRIAHDLLTPLTVVSTNVQRVEKHPEEAIELMRESQEEIMRMAKMINNALLPDSEGSAES